ncbi:NADP-dependent 3-hydroxy acid dehydrogenase YdfG [Pseudorhizobium tarimense]|uniref:NADP-dependent 3-hydroxy acid dehydrogenase YdfG n=1 Tax=Pseudorhizobium tarimense TaxID=1079109 RepID=A0ABV2H4I8_9HYPH
MALRLGNEGWTDAVSARSAGKLAELEALRPGRIFSFPLDVTEQEAVPTTVDRIEQALGQIALALLSAGSYKRDSATRFKGSALADVMELNVVGTGYCMDAAIPRMVARRAGHTAVIASVAGYVGLPGGAFYGAPKRLSTSCVRGSTPNLSGKA